ncbi:MAG: hypothetical protein QGF25_05670 [Candidatus Woesearchaeota archaeon]|jgi:hypothetical protein|nr:hypothetical protein [Candidatus Woesearchaeota archaeon]MDP7467701.1 hypothetical protein [Candidatus Woesearchaeota archaeon]MDP7646785.1 hypothetical protein [Candidatus Woesearchaeota archaeon]|tara:strand:+ start:1592 stop:1921 length:330 start_codon:yes stop_codon:yes gene_type:complete
MGLLQEMREFARSPVGYTSIAALSVLGGGCEYDEHTQKQYNIPISASLTADQAAYFTRFNALSLKEQNELLNDPLLKDQNIDRKSPGFEDLIILYNVDKNVNGAILRGL